MKTYTGIKKHSVTLGLSLLLLGLGQNNAHALTLPDVPLAVFSTVEHNVLLTFDDSGSMAWGYLPDTISGNGGTRRFCSSTFNGIAYNPATTYTPPPVRTNPGNLLSTPANLPDASFTAAWVNGLIGGTATVGTNAINLSTGYRPVSSLNVLSGAVASNTYATCSLAAAGVAAFYYAYDATLGGCSPQTIITQGNDACYRLVQHNNAAAGGAWTAAQQTNFANWYSYYRVRNLTAKSAAGRAFRGLPTNVRVAGQHLNNVSATGGPASGATFTNSATPSAVNMMRRFCDDATSTDSLCKDATIARTDFFTRLYNSPANSGTPLRQAMQRAGNFFGTVNIGTFSPYRDVPGDPFTATTNLELSCRKNFHIMMTDGYWNGTAGVAGNMDNTTRTLPDGTTYTPQAPYRDSWSSTLADNAFEYWRQDLRPTLTNNVRASEQDATGTATQRYWNPVNDPATWQHMQTFTIGLGIPGTLTNDTATNGPTYTGLKAGTIPWPQPAADSINNIDDLWHAAINGRGAYFDSRTPDDLINAFSEIIGQINRITGSAAGLASSGNTTSGGTSVFQVAYDTASWAGRLLSKQVDTTGNPTIDNWEASIVLNTQNYDTGRNIFTYNPTNPVGSRGVRFRWASLSAAQQTALNTNPLNVVDAYGSERLLYLRGSSTFEGVPATATTPSFRERSCYSPATVTTPDPTVITCPANVGKLGDIIDSVPVYVGKPDFAYPDTIESVQYSAFVSAQAGRQAMVYVGANDGMLHGFRASDGREEMAYVPNLVYSNITTNNLSLLAYPSYSHRFYVNGTPAVADVFIGGAWRTMLVGGLRRGGKGYYALDITNPAGFGESAGNAQALVKWEFTDPDLGFSYSEPKIVKLATGQWAAVFGNGYNSTGTGHSVIFIVNIETGALISKIDTSVSGGGGAIASGVATNGMGTPAVVDMNDDYIADYIYAGDLLGKMWRIDVRSPNAANWSLAASVTPLFTTSDGALPTPAVQPITTKPAVGFHPAGFGGLMVYFGTGKFLENNDNNTGPSPQTQTFYGIYDRGVTGRSAEPTQQESSPITRAVLLQQTIDTTIGTVGTFSTRNISDNPIAWRLDRTSTTTHLGWYVNLPTPGEKQVTNSIVREGRIIFTTLSPGTDACEPTGSGWLMELNSANGGRIKETIDTNGDGKFDSLDNSGLAYGPAGVLSAGGGLSSPIILTNPPGPPPPGGPACTETKLVTNQDGAIVRMQEACKAAAPAAWRQPR